jgi:hypothetical protein
MNITIEELIELAQEVEQGDPVDWSTLGITKDNAYYTIASQLFEMKDSFDQKMLLAMVVKLLVENFVLHTKNLQRNA